MKINIESMKNQLVCLLMFVSLCVSCEQRKIATKNADNQVDTTKTKLTRTEEQPTENLMIWTTYLDSTISYLNIRPNIKDTTWSNDYGRIQIKDYFQQGVLIGFLQPSMIFQQPDSMALATSTVYILQKHDGLWKLFKDKLPLNLNNNQEFIYDLENIKVIDVDFDQQPDLCVQYSIQHASREISDFYFFTFDKNQKQIKYKNHLYSMDTIAILATDKTLITWGDGGNYGTNHKIVYCWQANKLQEIKRLERTWCEKNKIEGDCMSEYVLKNNKLVLKQKWFEKENGVEYFEKWQ